jgi:hypothetical protein
MSIASGFAKTNRVGDVVLERLQAKVRRQLEEQGFANRSLLEQVQFDREQAAKKADAADTYGRTEKANQDAIAREKAAIEADVNNDDSLDPGVKKRALGLSALSTPESLARAQSLIDEHRKKAATKTDKAAEYKDKIATLGGWSEARKQNPRLVSEAEVYGVKPEKSEKIPKPEWTPRDMVKRGLQVVATQETAAQKLAIELKKTDENPTKVAADYLDEAREIIGMPKSKRKALASWYRSPEAGMEFSREAGDSLAAIIDEPPDGEAADPSVVSGDLMPGIGTSTRPKTQDEWDSLPANPETGYVQPPLSKATSMPTGAAIDPNAKPASILGRDQTGIPAKPGISVTTGQPATPAAGMVSSEQEAKLREQQARVDRILRELEEELGTGQ